MKPVRLKHDGPITVYFVPDIVADHLKEYCLRFCCDWLPEDPDAVKYRIEINGSYGLCYNESDFIDYLNTYIFPDQPSCMAPDAEPVWDNSDLPPKYRRVPYFSF